LKMLKPQPAYSLLFSTAPSTVSWLPSSKVTDFRLVQLQKAKPPISFRFYGFL
jgi:hypothetical protein